MKSPPQQIHDDIAFNRVEAFIRGEDNETLVGTEEPQKRKLRKLASRPASAAEGSRRRRRARRRRRGVSPATSRASPSRRRTGGRGRGPRPVEKSAIVAYRAGTWLMGRLPGAVARCDRQLRAPGLVLPRGRAKRRT